MKLSSSKKALGGLVLSGAVMLTGVVGFAQQQTTTPGESGQAERTEREGRRGGRKGWDGEKRGFGLFAKLNLTDAQKEQMKQIAARYRESGKALRQQTRGLRGGNFGPGATTGTFDEAAVRAEAQKRAAARVEMEVAHARMMSEMYAVLTAEQKAQLATWRQEREQKRQERRARRNATQPGQ